MQMECNVRVHKNGAIKSYRVEKGTVLLKFLQRIRIDLHTPCGGKGTCGKCRVRASGLSEPVRKERDLLGAKGIAKGYRLACFNKIDSDADVFIDDEDNYGSASIKTEGKWRRFDLDPIVKKRFAKLDAPSLDDQDSDEERVLRGMKGSGTSGSIKLLHRLPDAIRDNDCSVTLVQVDGSLVSVEPGDTSYKAYGIAVDIGTTTIAAYLYDMISGKRTDVYSVLNPQRKFGADVISRIEHTISQPGGLDEMNDEIVSCMNGMIGYFAGNTGISAGDIYACVFVGNTTMMHFLMKVPARNIAISPFIPVTTRLCSFPAGDMGIGINPFGSAVVFPGVSAYIGADTVAAVLSSGMYKGGRISLLLDIGTNGEIVLGNGKWMYACSAAAGPAFEGANIRNGVGGIKGAIDTVRLIPEFTCTTIGSMRPIGICGSGLVDAIAGMLKAGVIDETGRIAGRDEYDDAGSGLGGRLVGMDGGNAFMLVRCDECEAGADIAITQKDVRELQNAKAAIAAGIRILADKAEIRMEEIDRVYLAGGFGSYIDTESAFAIGLLPGELRGKVESIGNAAGTGAIFGLLSGKLLADTEKLKKRIRYVELSACPEFMDRYVECMMFE